MQWWHLTSTHLAIIVPHPFKCMGPKLQKQFSPEADFSIAPKDFSFIGKKPFPTVSKEMMHPLCPPTLPPKTSIRKSKAKNIFRKAHILFENLSFSAVSTSNEQNNMNS